MIHDCVWLQEQRIVDFDHLDKYVDEFKNFDVGYCCLGARRRIAGAVSLHHLFHFYIAALCQRRMYAVIVCLSVCASVTSRCSTMTDKPMGSCKQRHTI